MSNTGIGKLRFERLQHASEEGFETALAIYTHAFPENERHPAALIQERINNGSNQLIVGRLDQEIVFMALLWPLTGTPFILLDYMATHEQHRGKRIGGRFLAHMKPLLAAGNKYFILEAEDSAYGLNREQREQRVRFYRSHGARQLVGVQFLLPALQEGTATQMILMIFPDWPGNSIDSATVGDLIRRIYKELYNLDEQEALANSSGYIHQTAIALW